MLTIESFFSSSHFFGPLRNILDMSTPSISEPDKGAASSPSPEQISSQTMTSSPPSDERARPRRRPCRTRIKQPQPGSLYDIMHDNMGSSLYIIPICWSDMHARLLGVRFQELRPILYPLPGSKLCGWDSCPPARIASDLSHDLSTLLASEKTSRWFTKTQAVKKVMKTMFPETLSHPKSNAELHLFFGDRVHQKVVRAPIIWAQSDDDRMSSDSAVTQPATSLDRTPPSSKEPSSSPPVRSRPLLAYINKKQLKAIRSNLYRVSSGPRGDHDNFPVRSLQQLRSKQLIPAEEDQDAHYVAVMLAMAQSHIYGTAGSRARPGSPPRYGGGRILDSPPTSFSDVKVHLMTHSEDTAEFVIYQAEITSTFLERFASPTKAPSADVDPGLDVTYHRVPIWPILGLKERLAQALGSEIAPESLANRDWSEDWASNDVETWLSAEEKHERRFVKRAVSAAINVKRKRAAAVEQQQREQQERAALHEVVNSSFEDDASTQSSTRSEKDVPVLSPDAKRRCTRAATANPLEVC